MVVVGPGVVTGAGGAIVVVVVGAVVVVVVVGGRVVVVVVVVDVVEVVVDVVMLELGGVLVVSTAGVEQAASRKTRVASFFTPTLWPTAGSLMQTYEENHPGLSVGVSGLVDGRDAHMSTLDLPLAANEHVVCYPIIGFREVVVEVEQLVV